MMVVKNERGLLGLRTLKSTVSQWPTDKMIIQYAITIHILPNISRIKGNQTLKFGQIIKYNNRNDFLQKSCIKWSRDASSRPLFVFLKSFIWGKSKWYAAQFKALSTVLNLANNWNKIYITLKCWYRDILNSDFLEKSLVTVFLTYFVYDISRKIFFMLYSINYPDFIAWLPLLLEVLLNMGIAIVC